MTDKRFYMLTSMHNGNTHIVYFDLVLATISLTVAQSQRGGALFNSVGS